MDNEGFERERSRKGVHGVMIPGPLFDMLSERQGHCFPLYGVPHLPCLWRNVYPSFVPAAWNTSSRDLRGKDCPKATRTEGRRNTHYTG